MTIRIEWHPEAADDLVQVASADRHRIRKVLADLRQLDDARQRLVPYSGALHGFWKLRVGDYRLICRLAFENGQTVIVIHLVHRSVAYKARSMRTIRKRGD